MSKGKDRFRLENIIPTSIFGHVLNIKDIEVNRIIEIRKNIIMYKIDPDQTDFNFDDKNKTMSTSLFNYIQLNFPLTEDNKIYYSSITEYIDGTEIKKLNNGIFIKLYYVDFSAMNDAESKMILNRIPNGPFFAKIKKSENICSFYKIKDNYLGYSFNPKNNKFSIFKSI